ENSLDHHIGGCDATAVRVGTEAALRGSERLRVAQFPFEPFRGARPRRRDVLHLPGLKRYIQTAESAPGGDVATHDAGTDDVHATGFGAAAAELLEALLQEVDADEIARGGRHDEARE